MAKDAGNERLWRSVKPILSAEKDDKGRIQGLGTGFVCGRDGATVYLLTCWHVVQTIGAKHLQVLGRPARVVAHGDDALDLALLAVDDLPDIEILSLSAVGGSDLSFRTIGYFWADDKKQNVTWRPLEGQLGAERGDTSESYHATGWEFKIHVKDEVFDRIRDGNSGAPVFNAKSGVVAVISKKVGDPRGIAVAVANLKTIYPNADQFFAQVPADEGSGFFAQAPADEGSSSDPWIVKTLDHRQAVELRARLNAAGPPVVAMVEGCSDDWPNYLADDVFLDPWPGFNKKPQGEAITLNPTRYGDGEAAFWAALYHQIVPGAARPVAAGNREREAACCSLRGRDRHLFFVSGNTRAIRRLQRLIRAGQDFLAELARREPGMRLLMLVACQPSWWWSLCRRHLQRTPGVLWLEPLRPLQSPDLDEWYNGFPKEIEKYLDRDQLRDELLDLFDERRTEVRYRLVRKRLLNEGALERARKKPA